MQTHRHAAGIQTLSLPLERLFRHELPLSQPHIMHQAWERGVLLFREHSSVGQGRVTLTLWGYTPALHSLSWGLPLELTYFFWPQLHDF